MADYYSHKDPRKKGTDPYHDYDAGSGATWIWALVVLVAVVALIALGSSGGGGDVTAPAANGEVTAPAATGETAAPTVNE